jgi:hypothetical protein
MSIELRLCGLLARPLAVLVLAGAAQADPVSITGGFTQYIGPVEQPSALGYQSVFGRFGYTLPASPTEAIPGLDYAYTRGIGQGYVGLTGAFTAPAPSVEFYRDRAIDPPVHNRIEFAPTQAADVQVGDVFKLGTFSFTNGDWLGDFPDGRFLFQMQTLSSTPALNNHVFNGSLNFHITTGCSADYQTCSTDPDANADYFYVEGHPEFGYIGVYETAFLPAAGSNTGSIDLYGKIGSLIPTGFANAQGVGLLADIPQVNNLPAVAEPSPALLFLGGMATLALTRRRLRGA